MWEFLLLYSQHFLAHSLSLLVVFLFQSIIPWCSISDRTPNAKPIASYQASGCRQKRLLQSESESLFAPFHSSARLSHAEFRRPLKYTLISHNYISDEYSIECYNAIIARYILRITIVSQLDCPYIRAFLSI